MDRLPRHQLEESRDYFAFIAPPLFEQDFEPIRRGRYTEIDTLIKLTEKLELSGLREPGNVLVELVQECERYQLLQKELHATIARSLQLSTVMQEKIDSIASHLKALLTNEQAQQIADAPDVPAPSRLVIEKTTDSSSAPLKEDLPLTLSATCLRPFAVAINNKPIELCSNRNGQAILRYLVAQPNHSATADVFMDILWPEDEPDVSSRKLHVTMSILRRSLNHSHGGVPKDGYILFKQHTYQLNPSIPLRIDVDDYIALYNAGNRASRESAIAMGYYERACDIYSRPFLVEDIYADWSFIHREQLRQIHIYMCTALAEHYLAAHAYSKAAHWATVIIEENRCDEVAYRLLMKANALDGRRGDALRQYQHCQEVMRTELGMQPVSETTALYQAIVNGEITSP